MYDQALMYYRRSLAFNITDTAGRRSIAIDYFSIARHLPPNDERSPAG